MKLFMINPGTLISISNIASIEMQPDSRSVVFMTNGKVYSGTKEKTMELISMLMETDLEDNLMH